MFVIQVDKSKLTMIESEILVNNAVNVYPIRFSFSSDWSKFSKVAVFYNDFEEESKRYSVLIDNSNEIFIPREVLVNPGGTVYVGICGEGSDIKHLPTLVISLGQVREGICNDFSEAQDPTPSIYQQILSQLSSIKDDINSGKLKGDPGPRGSKGEQGIKGEKGDPGENGVTMEQVDQAIGNAMKDAVTMEQVDQAIDDAISKAIDDAINEVYYGTSK